MLNANGTLKDASEITFYESETDEQPISLVTKNKSKQNSSCAQITQDSDSKVPQPKDDTVELDDNCENEDDDPEVEYQEIQEERGMDAKARLPDTFKHWTHLTPHSPPSLPFPFHHPTPFAVHPNECFQHCGLPSTGLTHIPHPYSISTDPFHPLINPLHPQTNETNMFSTVDRLRPPQLASLIPLPFH
ncbi:hypothetical protein PAXRUDRAFT_19885 [Paxillus rubicundulus Ve08.2h10]|uniref:Uncharacterized protein n=1 Tax=Paxillus rubicundulus Ve08.2h10 TaxID=930991 RepID=A0A0D0CTT9_9AGAM|nr:hypothetical protein PAXRUDRAFT_19885 [Paxillus rubicundulus Ve08.2h10]